MECFLVKFSDESNLCTELVTPSDRLESKYSIALLLPRLLQPVMRITCFCESHAPNRQSNYAN